MNSWALNTLVSGLIQLLQLLGIPVGFLSLNSGLSVLLNAFLLCKVSLLNVGC